MIAGHPDPHSTYALAVFRTIYIPIEWVAVKFLVFGSSVDWYMNLWAQWFLANAC